ncbi:hypothetical protein L228DRAFT_258885 [Xylona heveae TC161]|uniref:Monopolin complex subunit Csm1/Pcs1 C-terminal domain-containing protein n=1 Tax=Xylona heveae (strain CBS 132557 / TC161) TaxID=1328760 RepID=A0A165IW60_XYLHT|nr:hypothetical protein L228DRAFT_258885 [Xylona heveae TC161]KZF25464.1 hypothetical protein L228DRAFT_258885 [Xylona heveae TC161]
MPPKRKGPATLANMVDSGSDGEPEPSSQMLTPPSAGENGEPPAKRARGRPKGSAIKSTKAKEPAQSATRSSGRKAAPAKPEPATKGAASRSKSEKTVPAKRKLTAQSKDLEINVEKETAKKEIPESQPLPVTVPEDSFVSDGEDDISAPMSQYPPAHSRISPAKSRDIMVPPRRGRNGSEAEPHGGDPALRRKLGDMTKKYENLDFKYRALRDLGIKEAEANFDKYKKQTDERHKAANQLIGSLKEQLATQTTLGQKSKTLQKQLDERDAELDKLRAKVNQLSSSLAEAQRETKAISTKLAATRTAASTVQSADVKVPGSAIKGGAQARTIMMGSAEAAAAAQKAQLKEDLYSDLTGLILRGVQREHDADIYDCIQTGRNGTLHFKLEVAIHGESYETTEFQYIPLLDANRDRDLLELLPDYLSEEITFPRSQAGRFYAKIVETLTRRIIEE